MGWEGPAHRRPRRLEPLMAVAVSVLICGPGVPWNAVVFAQIPKQVASGTSRPSTDNSSFPASLPSSVGLPGSTASTRSLSTGQSSMEATLEVDSGPPGTSLPQDVSVGVTTKKEGILPFTFPAKTTASPTSLGQAGATQSLAMMYSALPESTSREMTNSEQRTSPSSRPQANGTPSQNSSTERMVPEFSSLRTSSTDGPLAREASTDTHREETTDGPLTDKYTDLTDIPVMEDSRPGSIQDTEHLPAAIPASTDTSTDLTVSKKNVPKSIISSEPQTAGAHTPGNTDRLFENPSSSVLESTPTGTPEGWGRNRLELTQMNMAHPFSSPDPRSAADTVENTRVPLLSSASAVGDKVSGPSTFSVQRVTASVTTGTPETTGSPQPNSDVPLSMTISNAATGAERVRSTTSPQARLAPSAEGTAGSVHTLSTSSDTADPPSVPTARTGASEWSGGPRNASLASVSGINTTFSPSSHSTSVVTNTHLFIPGDESKETLRPSVSQSETSAFRVTSPFAIPSAPAHDFPNMDTPTSLPALSSPSHLVSGLRGTSHDSVMNSTSTAIPNTSHRLRNWAFPSVAATPQADTGTFNYSSAPGNTSWPETSSNFDTGSPLTQSTVPASATPLPATVGVTRFTSPTTSSMARTSLRRTSTAILATESTSGPDTVPFTDSTNLTTTRGYDSEGRLGTNHLPTGSTSPSETSTDVTVAKERVPIPVSPSQSMGADASSTPERKSQLVSIFPDTPYHLTTGGITVSVSQPLPSQMVTVHSFPEPGSAGSNWLSSLSSSPAPAVAAPVTVTPTVPNQRVTTSMIIEADDPRKWNMPSSPSITSLSLSNTPTRADIGESTTISRGTLSPAPLMELSERRFPPLSSSPESTNIPSISLRAHTTALAGSSPLPTPRFMETTTPVSIVKMETNDVSYSSGSQSEMSVPREASTSGSWASTTTRYPHVPSSTRLSLSHAIQELRTADSSPRTEATSPATHPEGLETLKIPHPASPATIAWTSTDAVEHSTRSPGTNPASETQSAPAPVSVDVSTSSTTGSSTSEPTSDAPGESLALTTTAHNTITSWLWALTTSLPMETRLRTSSTEEIVPDVSSPSSSKTFATFSRVSIPPHKLSNPGVDTSALQNTDSTTLVQHLEEFRFSGTAGDLTPLPATASQDLTVSPKRSASISLIYSSSDTTTIGVTTESSTDVPESSFPGLSNTEARKSSSPLPPSTTPSTETTSPTVLTALVLNPRASRKRPTPSQPVSSTSQGLEESVATTTVELSEGPHGGTTGSVGNFSSLVTVTSLGLIPSTSSTNIQSRKTTALAGTGSPEDLSWSLSSAAGEDGTLDITSANVTTSVARSEPPKATTSGRAESPATKESFLVQARPAPVPDKSTPFTSKDHLFLNSFALRF
ncbi:mucin-16-like [Rhinolophus sinicus]|uniref:mucin-16-like n=1 Tax=Rhinolophus sinicus TaxID=89399 RepID=UPI003D7BD684